MESIAARLREERDDALKAKDRAQAKLRSTQMELESMRRQRDQLAQRLANVLRIDMEKKEPGAPPPGPRTERPASKGKKLTQDELDKVVDRLYKKAAEDKKAAIKRIDESVYKDMEEKRKGKRVLKSKADLQENIKHVYEQKVHERRLLHERLEGLRAKEAQRSQEKLGKGALEASVERLSQPRGSPRAASYT